MRAIARPAAAPIAVASVALAAAMARLRPAARSMRSLPRSSPYQRSEKPLQLVSSGESLKEKATSTRIGR